MTRLDFSWTIAGVLTLGCVDAGETGASSPIAEADAGKTSANGTSKKRRTPPHDQADAALIVVPVLPLPSRPDEPTYSDASTSEPDDVAATPSHDGGSLAEEPIPTEGMGNLRDSGPSGPETPAFDASVSPPWSARDASVDAVPCDGGRCATSDGSVDASSTPASMVDAAFASGADAAEPDHDPTFDAGQHCIAECAAVGAECVDQGCVFDCSEGGACAGFLECPDERACSVTCGSGACGGGIECPDDSTCDVQCNGDDSCVGDITCHGFRCDIGCHGARSCQGAVGGGASQVTIVCDAAESCGQVMCDADDCDITCSATNSCNSVRANATNARTTCAGTNSCDEIDCSASQCDVRCPGEGSCDEVSCSAGIVTPPCF